MSSKDVFERNKKKNIFRKTITHLWKKENKRSSPKPDFSTTSLSVKMNGLAVSKEVKAIEKADTGYDLAPCSSRKCKCCDPQLGSMPVAMILSYVVHYSNQYDRIKKATLAKGETFDYASASSEIFNEDLITPLLARISYERPIGIVNPSRECFAIAMIQSFVGIPAFQCFVKYKAPVTKLDYDMRAFIVQYNVGFRDVSVSKILRDVFSNYVTGSHEDSFQYLLEFIQNYMKDSELTTVVSKTTFECMNCKKSESTKQSNSYLHVDWPRRVFEYRKFLTIGDLLLNTAKITELEKRCSFCKFEKARAKTVHQLPEILVVYICSYTYNSESSKNMPREGWNLEFEEREDFSVLTEADCENFYNLSAIVFYVKFSENTGHYYTMVNDETGVTILNDGEVSRVDSLSDGAGNLKGRPYYAVYTKKKKGGSSGYQTASSSTPSP